MYIAHSLRKTDRQGMTMTMLKEMIHSVCVVVVVEFTQISYYLGLVNEEMRPCSSPEPKLVNQIAAPSPNFSVLKNSKLLEVSSSHFGIKRSAMISIAVAEPSSETFALIRGQGDRLTWVDLACLK